MSVCMYCKAKLNSDKAKKDGFHEICHTKRGGTVRKENCMYCKKRLTNISNQKKGYHPMCLKNKLKPKQDKAKKNSSVQSNEILTQKPNSFREFLINSIIVTKKAFHKTSSLFDEADLRMGKLEKKLSEEDAYEIAALEIEHGQYRRGLWAKSYAEANGDKQIQKAIYCKLRATQLLEIVDLLK